MRMKKKRHGGERLSLLSALTTQNPCELVKNVEAEYANSNPLRIEIGCGKGNFPCGMAAKHPEINFIAVEKVADVCCIALEKAKARTEERSGDNLRFIISDAKELSENVLPHSLDCIYLNFSDPWPKSGHAKRRLTHRGFLEMYKKLLKEDGILRLKTDNVGLFDFSLEEFEEFGMQILWQTRDLHSEPENADNVMTEYEKNFSDKGQPIYSAVAKF